MEHLSELFCCFVECVASMPFGGSGPLTAISIGEDGRYRNVVFAFVWHTMTFLGRVLKNYEDTCNSNVRVNMLYHFCVSIVALITVLTRITRTNFRAERTQTKGDTTCNRTSELQVSSYSVSHVPVLLCFSICVSSFNVGVSVLRLARTGRGTFDLVAVAQY